MPPLLAFRGAPAGIIPAGPLLGIGQPAATVEDYATWFHTPAEPTESLPSPTTLLANARIDQIADADPAFGATEIDVFERSTG